MICFDLFSRSGAWRRRDEEEGEEEDDGMRDRKERYGK